MTWGWGAGPKISEILKMGGRGSQKNKVWRTSYGCTPSLSRPEQKKIFDIFGGGDEKALTSTAAVTVFPPFELR